MDERPAGIPAPTLELSESEQRLLDAVRTGAPDAEIAVRLGVSNGEVKTRIERLASKLGVGGRQGLKAWESLRSPESVVACPVEHSHGSRTSLTAGLLFLLLAGGVFAVSRRATSDDSSPPRPATLEVYPTSRPWKPSLSAIDARMMYDLGQLFAVDGYPMPAAAVETREASAVVTLEGPGEILLGPQQANWGIVGWGPHVVQLFGTIDEDAGWYLTIQAVDSDTRFESLEFVLGEGTKRLRVFSVSTELSPVVIMTARHRFSNDPYHLTLSHWGHVFISKEAVHRGFGIESSTGAALEVTDRLSRAKLMLNGGSGYHSTHCVNSSACWVAYHAGAGPLLAPFGGSYACPVETFSPPSEDFPAEARRQVMSITTESFVLFLARHSMFSAELDPFECRARPGVTEGEILYGADRFLIAAKDLNGNWLDVVVALDGTLHIGSVTTEVACPCLGGT